MRSPHRVLTASLAACALMATGIASARAEVPAPTSPDQITQIVDEMTLDELIGQMTWTHVYGNSAYDTSMASSNQKVYGADVSTPAQAIEKYDLGGVLYFAWSNPVVTNNPGATAALSNSLQTVSLGDNASGIPLAVTIDQEGGIVARMGEPATVFPNAMALGATGSTDLARQQGEILAQELTAVGVNVDFAPDLDVNTNPDNPVIGVRSFGEDPELVADLGVAVIEGMQDNGLAATGKHFPGHGDTAVDSHYGLPSIEYDRATLEQHLIPFRAAIGADVDMIMSAHILVKVLDPEMPGTLSPKVMNDLLREELGFDGLITTDAINMDALRKLPDHPLTEGEIAVRAVQAGSDILLNSVTVEEHFEGIRQAVANGELTRERLEESVTRILNWKLERGVWADPMVDVTAVGDLVGSDESQAVADEIARRAVTVVHNDGDALTVTKDQDLLLVGSSRTKSDVFVSELEDRGFTVDSRYPANDKDDDAYATYIEDAVAQAADTDVIIVTTYNATSSPAQQKLIRAMVETGKPVVVVGMRNPYDVKVADGAAAVVNTYGWAPINFRALAEVITGEFAPTGTLPVSIKDQDGTALYEIGHGVTDLDPAPVQQWVSTNTAGMAPVGTRAGVWGTAHGAQAGDTIVVQALVDGRWVNSQQTTLGENLGYVLPLTYGQNQTGAQRYRVVVSTSGGFLVSETFSVTRTR